MKFIKSVPYFVRFQIIPVEDLKTMLCNHTKVSCLSFTLLLDSVNLTFGIYGREEKEFEKLILKIQ